MIEQVAKAYLVEIGSNSEKTSPSEGRVEVHFNPQTLKVAYANQNKGGEQPKGASAQNVGNLTSKLSVELLFDTTGTENILSGQSKDVREETQKIVKFIMPKNVETKSAPPLTRFQWGSFIFEGVVDSINETLEYFSADGLPLRATISLSMKSDNIASLINKTNGNALIDLSVSGIGASTPLSQTRPGDTVQQMAGRLGRSRDWKSIAAANNIDDPLRPVPGALLNMNN
ncbi:MAG: peptidoglycan-binding protein [Chloroflexi bacterium]|nr:MAG: peptidoglycan-binding protein [Chloroflexota bacterium]